MRAVMCRQFGGPETLRVEETASAPLESDQVRIRVYAAGINFADTLMIAGTYQVKPPFPLTPGMEAAGEIVEVGAAAKEFQVGQRVLATARGGGTYADEMVAREVNVVPIPDAMAYDVAASFPVVYGTSHFALKDRGQLQPGETLLVLGAAGGVGLTAVEIGKRWGAQAARDPAFVNRQLRELVGWWQQGKLKPEIGARFPLEKAGDAMTALLSRKYPGKIVLTCD